MIDKKGNYCTLVVKSWNNWQGCFDLSKWLFMNYFENGLEKYEVTFRAFNPDQDKPMKRTLSPKVKIGNQHKVRIENIRGETYVSIDDGEKLHVQIRRDRETNYWAVENAVRAILNKQLG